MLTCTVQPREFPTTIGRPPEIRYHGTDVTSKAYLAYRMGGYACAVQLNRLVELARQDGYAVLVLPTLATGQNDG